MGKGTFGWLIKSSFKVRKPYIAGDLWLCKLEPLGFWKETVLDFQTLAELKAGSWVEMFHLSGKDRIGAGSSDDRLAKR